MSRPRPGNIRPALTTLFSPGACALRLLFLVSRSANIAVISSTRCGVSCPMGMNSGPCRPHRLEADALNAIEPQILDAVRSCATRPDTVSPGQMRAVVEHDQGGTKITKWIGQESFIHEF